MPCSLPACMGARVLGISSSDEKLERARALGLDGGLNYRKTPEWDRWVVEQTGGDGADLVVEVGGVGTLPLSLRAARMRGVIAQIGILAGRAEDLPLPLIFHKQLRIHGIYVGSRHNFEEMNKAITLATMRPIFESFPWANARDVLHRMESGSHFGKLVLTVE